MRVHHLNCMTFRQGLPSYREVTHCLLLETGDGLVLVDCGLGMGDYEKPPWRMRLFTAVDRVAGDVEETAIRQVTRLGYSARDVRHIVLTHLHLDHSGGLPDFPWAQVHVLKKEYEAASTPHTLLAWYSYEPGHWSHSPRWVFHGGECINWFDMPGFSLMAGGWGQIVLIPLEGHSQGHCGVAVDTGAGWLLHCGDAFVRQMQVDPVAPKSPFPGWFAPMERVMFPDAAQARLRILMRDHADEIGLICAHDPDVFDALAGGN